MNPHVFGFRAVATPLLNPVRLPVATVSMPVVALLTGALVFELSPRHLNCVYIDGVCHLQLDTTCESVTAGPRDASIGCRPSKSVMYATLPDTNDKGTGVNHVAQSGGCYLYDSKAIAESRDAELDPRRPSAKASTDQRHGRERTAPYGFESLQVQCGGAIQPRHGATQFAACDPCHVAAT
eukprot:COSAG03_NODE_5009_length_1365_cov_2.190363_1_plen_181_part_00